MAVSVKLVEYNRRNNSSYSICISASQILEEFFDYFTNDLKLELKIYNNSYETIPKASVIKVSGGKFYSYGFAQLDYDLLPSQRAVVTMTLANNGYQSLEFFPKYLFVNLFFAGGQNPIQTYPSGYCLQLYNFTGDIYSWNYKSNILVFGVAGNGKSTLINSIISSLDSNLVELAAVLNSGQHVTTEVSSYSLSKLEKYGKHSFQLYDSPGLAENTYRDISLFTSLINGHLDIDAFAPVNNLSDDSVIAEKAISSIIFVISQAGIASKPLMEKLQTFIAKALTQLFIRPILVITFADQIFEKDRAALINAFHLNTSIPLHQIFLIDNSNCYTRNFEKDKLLLNILRAALKNSKIYIDEEQKRNERKEKLRSYLRKSQYQPKITQQPVQPPVSGRTCPYCSKGCNTEFCATSGHRI